MEFADRTKTFIGYFWGTEVPGVQTTELTIRAAGLDVPVDEARELYSELVSASAIGSPTHRGCANVHSWPCGSAQP